MFNSKLYLTPQDYNAATRKSVALFGMSGLGKTRLSDILRNGDHWFHYSADYRIGSRYMAEPIADNFKALAMEIPFLADLLKRDAIDIHAKLRFEDLSPLSSFMGKPGNPDLGGLPFDEYCRRQALHREAEIRAMHDVGYFQHRAKSIYGYSNFVTDCSGSLCEIVSPDDPNCPVLSELSKSSLLVWIEGPETHRDKLIKRFQKQPKPMYFQPEFLAKKWSQYLDENTQSPNQVNPDDFMIWAYAALIDDRLPRYRSLAKNWGITISADDVEHITTPSQFNELIAGKL